jgi:hypothetical protein
METCILIKATAGTNFSKCCMFTHQIVEVADQSSIPLCNNGAQELVDPFHYNVSFMFGPFSSSLTKGVINITDSAEKVIMTAGSAYDSVWDGSVQYGFGELYMIYMSERTEYAY